MTTIRATGIDAFELAFANAQRLRADAELLADHKRGMSSLILGVFAIEELGKALIFRWKTRNLASKRNHPTHLEKQSAVFALLAAHQALTVDAAALASGEKPFNFVDMGGNAEQFAFARSGFYDDLRMAATYADPTPKWPRDMVDQLHKGIPEEICGFYDEAVALIDNDLSMRLAAEIYRHGLGRL